MSRKCLCHFYPLRLQSFGYLLNDCDTTGCFGSLNALFFYNACFLICIMLQERKTINVLMYMIAVFFLLALYLIAESLSFFAYLYLIIYVGAITIFFLFTLMLL